MRVIDRIVVLVRHAAPEIDADRPSSTWSLSQEGRDSCDFLTEHMRRLLPANLVSSSELKAMQTARIIAQRLGLELSTRNGLREHQRSGEFLTRSSFHSKIKVFFENPTSVVYGRESCDEVGLRIETEVEAALSRDSTKNAVLVTHGTAMTSYIVRHWHVDPFGLWKSLELPAYVAFTVPAFDIVGARGLDTTLFAKTLPEPGQ